MFCTRIAALIIVFINNCCTDPLSKLVSFICIVTTAVFTDVQLLLPVVLQ